MINAKNYYSFFLLLFFTILSAHTVKAQMHGGQLLDTQIKSPPLTPFQGGSDCCFVDGLYLSPGSWPGGIARAGDFFWNNETESNLIYKTDLQGNIVSTLLIPEYSSYYGGGLHYDGVYLWQHVEELIMMFKYHIGPDTLVAIYPMPSGFDGWGITGDEQYLWHSEYGVNGGSVIYTMDKATLNVLSTFNVPSSALLGIKYIGNHQILAIDGDTDDILRIDVLTGMVVDTQSLCLVYPLGIDVYNDSIFVVNSSILFDGDQMVYHYDSNNNTIPVTIDMVLNDSTATGTGGIFATVGGGTAPFMYSWTLDGNFFSNQEDIINLSAGIYQLTVTDDNGCVFVSAPIEVTGMVIANQASEVFDFFNVFPNPASSGFALDFDLHQPQDVRIDIYQSDGQHVLTKMYSSITKDTPYIVAENWEAGLYIIKINLDGEVYARKIMIQ